jgi:hypothetical protein
MREPQRRNRLQVTFVKTASSLTFFYIFGTLFSAAHYRSFFDPPLNRVQTQE